MSSFVEETHQKIYQKLGSNVYRFRALHRLTQENLAEKCDITGAYISQIERADLHKSITCTTLMRIAEALNVPVCVMLAQEPCPKYLDYLNETAINVSVLTDVKR